MKPIVAVSRCLLGEKVRYDGSDKAVPKLINALSTSFSIIPVCPEVEAGLSVPRPPVKLVRADNEAISALGRDNATLDVTLQLNNFAEHFCTLHPTLSGAILQNRSPSCGVGDTPLFSPSGESIMEVDGLFAATLRERCPGIPIAGVEQLNSILAVEEFLEMINRHR